MSDLRMELIRKKEWTQFAYAWFRLGWEKARLAKAELFRSYNLFHFRHHLNPQVVLDQ